MSFLTEFIAIFGTQEAEETASNGALVADSGMHEPEVYSSLDVEDIYDEEYDNAIDEEWD
jgi:hypothetical protein